MTLYWHELNPDAPADPERPCPEDCMACEEARKAEATPMDPKAPKYLSDIGLRDPYWRY